MFGNPFVFVAVAVLFGGFGGQLEAQEAEAESPLPIRLEIVSEGERSFLLVEPGEMARLVQTEAPIDYAYNIKEKTSYIRIKGDDVWVVIPEHVVRQSLKVAYVEPLGEGKSLLDKPTALYRVGMPYQKAENGVQHPVEGSCGEISTSPALSEATGLTLDDYILITGAPQVLVDTDDYEACTLGNMVLKVEGGAEPASRMGFPATSSIVDMWPLEIKSVTRLQAPIQPFEPARVVPYSASTKFNFMLKLAKNMGFNFETRDKSVPLETHLKQLEQRFIEEEQAR
jgi:hypothetical protein